MGWCGGSISPTSHRSDFPTHLRTSVPSRLRAPTLVRVDALIFVAVAVAWAAYLIPKALHHHEDAVRSRSVDRFSHRLRVLARREPVDHRSAALVVSQDRATPPWTAPTTPADPAPSPSPAEIRSRREAARRATRRRRRVLALIMVSLVAVAGVAGYGLVEWWYVAIPVGVLVAWLLACRLMVRGERRSWDRLVSPAPAPAAAAELVDPLDADTTTIETSTIPGALREPGSWDPVPVTLPTYVTKPTAERTVRTIDLDSTGVWTSGRTEADSALARQADEAARTAREADAARAVGSAG